MKTVQQPYKIDLKYLSLRIQEMIVGYITWNISIVKCSRATWSGSVSS